MVKKPTNERNTLKTDFTNSHIIFGVYEYRTNDGKLKEELVIKVNLPEDNILHSLNPFSKLSISERAPPFKNTSVKAHYFVHTFRSKKLKRIRTNHNM